VAKDTITDAVELCVATWVLCILCAGFRTRDSYTLHREPRDASSKAFVQGRASRDPTTRTYSVRRTIRVGLT
jgi:hypothetical protein